MEGKHWSKAKVLIILKTISWKKRQQNQSQKKLKIIKKQRNLKKKKRKKWRKANLSPKSNHSQRTA